jgi:CRISPR system Cascade subunit CasB
MPEEKITWGARFVGHLARLRDGGDRGALAVLRRALQRPPGDDPAAFPFVVPYLEDAKSRWEEDAAFLVASLFASHPDAGGSGTLGKAFRTLAAKTNGESVERRFVALLGARGEPLHHHLRHAVSLLRAGGVPVGWARLLTDVLWWEKGDGSVQRRWAKDFWGYTRETESDKASAAEAVREER